MDQMNQYNLFGVEYKCISMDPPWPEVGSGKIKRGANRHYPVIKKKEQICDTILNSGYWRPAESCHLWIWATNNYLEWGLWLMKELGFVYKTNRVWAKMEQLSAPGGIDVAKPVYKKQNHGLGQYFWSMHELLLFGTRGKAMLPPPKGRPDTLLLEPRTRQHSEKPAQAYKDMEFVSPGPYLEMFARDPRPGWDVWGLESEGNRVIEDEAKRIGR